MPDWLIWLIARWRSRSARSLTPGLFFLGPIALAAAAAAVVAAAGAGGRALAVFVVGSVASLALAAADRAPPPADAAACEPALPRWSAARAVVARAGRPRRGPGQDRRRGLDRPRVRRAIRCSSRGRGSRSPKIQGATALVYE